MNSDLTKYSRKETYDDYADIYKNLDAPVYEKLGNYDYCG
ncbi:conserved hypothetical protein (fragment) [Bartonella tribocorum CIP 105476]|uniref:Uncharacterized protein n=1 Tax=Bartonella tribocorum (strain DSM 28219 / CCUG 45778 / CIP 105476 / IBS 506) TaxID=382640 RepID=A9IXI8_BART1